jgi:hypothetical protein
MAMIEKRDPAQYRVRVRRADLPKAISKTFDFRGNAENWAHRIESEIDAGKRALFLSNAETRFMTLREALERYRDERQSTKQGQLQLHGHPKLGAGVAVVNRQKHFNAVHWRNS